MLLDSGGSRSSSYRARNVDDSGLAHLRHSLRLAPSMLMAMLTAYLDESGTHDGARAVAIGCYVASLDRWERFSGQWLDVLRDEGIEPPFHMVDFSHGVDRYAPWRDDVVKRARVIARPAVSLRRFYACGRVVEAARRSGTTSRHSGTTIATSRLIRTSLAFDSSPSGSCSAFGGGSHSVRIVIEQGHALMGTAIGQFYFDREYQAGWECLEGMDQETRRRFPRCKERTCLPMRATSSARKPCGARAIRIRCGGR